MAISIERRNRMLDAYGEARSKMIEALDILHGAPGGLAEAGGDIPLHAMATRDDLLASIRRIDRLLFSLEYEAEFEKERE